MADQPDPAIESLFAPDPATRACPYGHYDRIRETEGLYYSPTMEAYLVTRHADAMEVLSDPRRFSSRIPFGKVAIRRERAAIAALLESNAGLSDLIDRLRPRRKPMLSSADPPVHLRQRRLLGNLFGPRQIAEAEPFVRDLTDRLIDGFAEGGSVEIIAAFAVPLPVQVIAVLMGVEPDRQADFKHWSDCFMLSAGDNDDPAVLAGAIEGQVALFDFFREQIAERRAAPRDDLVTQIIEARQAGDEPFTDDEVGAVLAQFLVAGNETTTGLIGSCLLELARRPELVAGLRADPTAIPGFVEEMLRCESPAQSNFRQVLVDTTVGGFPVPAGSQLMVFHGAAGRDPQAFESNLPQIDAAQKKRHVSFGFGEHFCIGAPLARLEAKVVLEAMVARFESWSVEPGSTPAYVPLITARGLSRLDLRLVAAGGGQAV